MRRGGQDARSRDGQDVLYAARGQDARSRDGQDVLYAARGHACMDAGGRRRREQAVEEARSRPDAALPPASL